MSGCWLAIPRSWAWQLVYSSLLQCWWVSASCLPSAWPKRIASGWRSAWGLRLISALGDLASPEEVNGVYYLQEFIPPAQKHHQDWRLFVCQGRVIASMIRHGSSWITNIKQGARAKAAIASQELVDLAVRAASCVGADYAGVDIIQARDGRFFVLEVNSMPAWNGLQRVSRVRISDHLVDAFLDAALPEERREGQEGA